MHLNLGKTISFIGNPGTGKTTFLVASIQRLSELDWIKINLKKLPKDYGLWIDALVSGDALPPTVKDYEYPLEFRRTITYKGSTIKLGRFFGVTFKIRDLRGEDYRRTTSTFKESVHGASAILVTIDASHSTDLGKALSGQIQPLIDGIRYMVSEEDSLKYIGLIFTKRSFHNHVIADIRKWVLKYLGPVIRPLKEKGIEFRILEVDSRGAQNKFEPWGIEQVYYDVLSNLGTVTGTKIDVTLDADYVWVDTGVTPPPIVDTPPNPPPFVVSETSDPKAKLGQGAKPSRPPKPKPQAAPPTTPHTGVMYLVICPSCGYKNPQGLTKCKNCGAPL